MSVLLLLLLLLFLKCLFCCCFVCAGGGSWRPLSPRGGSDCSEGDGAAELLAPLQIGVAVKGMEEYSDRFLPHRKYNTTHTSYAVPSSGMPRVTSGMPRIMSRMPHVTCAELLRGPKKSQLYISYAFESAKISL